MGYVMGVVEVGGDVYNIALMVREFIFLIREVIKLCAKIKFKNSRLLP